MTSYIKKRGFIQEYNSWSFQHHQVGFTVIYLHIEQISAIRGDGEAGVGDGPVRFKERGLFAKELVLRNFGRPGDGDVLERMVALGGDPGEQRVPQLAAAGQLMRTNIETVMVTIPDPAARKQALFELWDECAESGDPELVSAGKTDRI